MPRTRRFVVTVGALVVAVALTPAACAGAPGPDTTPGSAPTAPSAHVPTSSSSSSSPATARQSVEALVSEVPVGGTVPADTLRDRLSAAVTEAGSWRTEFDDVWPVDVTAVLDQGGGPAVRVHGLDKDEPDSEVRLVGDVLYELDLRHVGGPMWIAGRRQDPDQLQRVTDQEVDDLVVIGSPTVLVEAIEEGKATVVSRTGSVVTVSVTLDDSGFSRIIGAGPSANGTVRSTWVIDHGLPVRVRSEIGGELPPDFRFSRWASAGPVEAPSGRRVESRRAHILAGPSHYPG